MLKICTIFTIFTFLLRNYNNHSNWNRHHFQNCGRFQESIPGHIQMTLTRSLFLHLFLQRLKLEREGTIPIRIRQNNESTGQERSDRFKVHPVTAVKRFLGNQPDKLTGSTSAFFRYDALFTVTPADKLPLSITSIIPSAMPPTNHQANVSDAHLQPDVWTSQTQSMPMITSRVISKCLLRVSVHSNSLAQRKCQQWWPSDKSTQLTNIIVIRFRGVGNKVVKSHSHSDVLYAMSSLFFSNLVFRPRFFNRCCQLCQGGGHLNISMHRISFCRTGCKWTCWIYKL